MVAGKQRELLTKESVLNRVSEYDIYRHFIGQDFKIGKVIHSPMPGRKDNHPSFIVGCKGGHYLHRDFADSRYSGNCFQFVMQKEMLPSYYAALIKIDKEMGLGIKNDVPDSFTRPVFVQPTIEDSKPRFFQVGYSSVLTDDEKAYWQQYYITSKELEDNEIYAVRWYMIDRRRQPMRPGELTFGYKSGPLWKIYRPYACKRRKWQMNFPNTLVEGVERVGKAENGVITKSRKDRIVLQKFLPSVVSVQNESVQALGEDLVNRLADDWKHTYLNFDGDDPGEENKELALAEYPTLWTLSMRNWYLEEGITDFSDLIKVHGPQAVERYLEKYNII